MHKISSLCCPRFIKMKPLRLNPFKREPKSKCGNNRTHKKDREKKKSVKHIYTKLKNQNKQ